MPQYNTTQEFSYLETEENLVLITNVTSGSVIVSAWDGTQYVTSDTIAESGTKILFVKGQKLRFQPTGDMVYTIKAGNS